MGMYTWSQGGYGDQKRVSDPLGTGRCEWPNLGFKQWSLARVASALIPCHLCKRGWILRKILAAFFCAGEPRSAYSKAFVEDKGTQITEPTLEPTWSTHNIWFLGLKDTIIETVLAKRKTLASVSKQTHMNEAGWLPRKEYGELNSKMGFFPMTWGWWADHMGQLT